MDVEILCKSGWQLYIFNASKIMRENNHDFIRLAGDQGDMTRLGSTWLSGLSLNIMLANSVRVRLKDK